jgi:hypothetical protein
VLLGASGGVAVPGVRAYGTRRPGTGLAAGAAVGGVAWVAAALWVAAVGVELYGTRPPRPPASGVASSTMVPSAAARPGMAAAAAACFWAPSCCLRSRLAAATAAKVPGLPQRPKGRGTGALGVDPGGLSWAAPVRLGGVARPVGVRSSAPLLTELMAAALPTAGLA